MVVFGNFGRLYPLPKPKPTYEQTLSQLVDSTFKHSPVVRKAFFEPYWSKGLDWCYDYIILVTRLQRIRGRDYSRLKPYKRISADYEAPFTLPIWCRRLYDKAVDFFYNLSSLTFEKWVFWLIFFYFAYIFFISIFYPLYSAVRKDFLHPRFFFRSPRWFVDENKIHRQTKFVLLYNLLIILFLVTFFLFYLYEAVRLVQYYDCYIYYRHLYHTVPFFEGGSSRRNGGVHDDLAWKKRLRHPENSMPAHYLLLVKDRW
jgi:hypothetical protein